MADEGKPNAFKEFCDDDSFNNGVHLKVTTLSMDDLIALGDCLVRAARREDLKLAIAVFGASGHRIFEVALPGTSSKNDMFLNRKLHTCQHFLMSTLGLCRYLASSGDTLSGKYGLSESDYAVVGGGVPIFVNDLLVAVVAVSGMHHEKEHRFLVEQLHALFKVE